MLLEVQATVLPFLSMWTVDLQNEYLPSISAAYGRRQKTGHYPV